MPVSQALTSMVNCSVHEDVRWAKASLELSKGGLCHRDTKEGGVVSSFSVGRQKAMVHLFPL